MKCKQTCSRNVGCCGKDVRVSRVEAVLGRIVPGGGVDAPEMFVHCW